MIDFLLGVPGKLKTVVDHLTTHLSSTRAAKIDQLDAAISTRAAASTAVSNADYTSVRAAKLDNVTQERSPIAASFSAPLGVALISDLSELQRAASVVGSKTNAWTSGTDYSLLTLTGPGVINFLAVVCPNSNTVNASITVIVDGVTVYPLTAQGAAAGTHYPIRAIVGSVGGGGVTNPTHINFGFLAFKTSIEVKVRVNASSTYSAYVYMNGYRT